MPAASGTTITLAVRNGSAEAYRAMPDRVPAAGVVMIPPIYGVTASMRTIADRFAARGYIALVPDPFWRTHPGPLVQDERPAALARMQAVIDTEMMDDLAFCVAALRAMPESNGTAVAIGYCFGGKYAFLAAARGMVDAAAAFHATRVGTALDEAPAVAVPVSFHYGDSDPVAPLDEVRDVERALAGQPDAEVAIYPGIGHGFTQTDQHGYHAETTAASEEAVFAMLAALA